MSDLQPPRGTHDILPEDHRRHRQVTETARGIAARYGYEEISTPVFEFSEVFKRTLGETSDIVTKEMFSFEDKKGRSLALRPEGTAGVARAFISGLRSEQLPLKLFYQGPMFRYERMQKGRQRQFHQFGVELLGADGPLADIEVITLGAHVLDALGVADKVTLELNTLGDAESRQSYRTKLVGYLEGFKDKLSEDSLARLDRNPLRILDSKDQGDRAVIAGAPLLADHLNDASKAFFEDVQKGLKTAGVEYEINPTLVRGLDYYCHTAFEFTTETLGAQGAVLAGGRYDGLIETMGGPPTPGTGWAAGVERLALMIAEPPGPARPVAVVPVGEAAEAEALSLTQKLRQAGFTADLGFSGNLKKRLKGANKAGAAAAVIIGEDELAKGAATVRDMETGEQTEVKLSALEDHLARYR
jgi:histidyl-tRNA synthetase|tara:strand:- start:4213 stop:5457 length:1245 start_codon:yes stop_codon:yes gene_type:complete